MIRRKFLSSAAVASAAGFSLAREAEKLGKENNQGEFYELRSYEMAFRGSKTGLMNFLNLAHGGLE